VEDSRLQPDTCAINRRSSETQRYMLTDRQCTSGLYIAYYAVLAAYAKTPKASASEICIVESCKVWL
jgi:hypothetical protein